MLRRTLPLWLAKKRTDAQSVSLKAELGRTAVADIISGKSAKPRYPNLVRIARAMDITIDQMFDDPFAEEMPVATDPQAVDLRGGGTAVAMRLGPAPHDLPIMGEGKAGLSGIFMGNGDPIALIPRPPVLHGVSTAFAVYVRGDSMIDRYYDGELVYVNPAKPVRHGSFVLIELKNHEAFIKRFVKRDNNLLTVEQFNPRCFIEYPESTVKHVYRIVGSGEDG